MNRWITQWVEVKGAHPEVAMSRTGVYAKGYKTRSPKKHSDSLIISKRKII